MVWLGLYSTNLNGPVPIGARRISRGETWHGYIGVEARGEQAEQRRLRRLQVEDGLVLAVGGHALDVGVPALAEVDLEVLRRVALQEIQGALHVGGRERLAVVPLDALAQREASSVLPSSLQVHFSARSGTMSSRLFCFLAGSNMTRLLNTPIIGSTTEIVPSSWIDMLAGLSRWVMRRMPPCFWAEALAKGADEQERKNHEPHARQRNAYHHGFPPRVTARIPGMELPDAWRAASMAEPIHLQHPPAAERVRRGDGANERVSLCWGAPLQWRVIAAAMATQPPHPEGAAPSSTSG